MPIVRRNAAHMGGANYPILLIFSDLAANTLYVCIYCTANTLTPILIEGRQQEWNRPPVESSTRSFFKIEMLEDIIEAISDLRRAGE